MLYSTKRKLHNLINGPPTPTPAPAPLEPPSTPPPTTAALNDALHKKRKLGQFSNRSRPSIRAVSPAGSVQSTVSTSSALPGSPLRGREGPQQTPAYAPWDRASFLDRLRTYRFVDRWTAKPPRVNEVAWSKRGWVCTEKNRVRCTVCRKEVVVKVEIDEDKDAETANAVVDRYESMIVSEHEDSCLWKKRGCDETIYRLQLANPTVSRPAFAARYTSLLKIRNEIPPSLSHPELDLCSIQHSPEATDDGPIYEAAVILALFGWQNEDPAIPSLVTCSACFRRLGLWLFRKKAIKLEDVLDSMEDLEGEEEASVSRLDVIGEHREYCPWINASSQGKEPGWQALHRVLQQSPKPASSALSTYSTTMDSPSKETPATPAERDAEEDSKLAKLKRLKTLYFGKSKKPKTKELAVGREKEDVGRDTSEMRKSA